MPPRARSCLRSLTFPVHVHVSPLWTKGNTGCPQFTLRCSDCIRCFPIVVAVSPVLAGKFTVSLYLTRFSRGRATPPSHPVSENRCGGDCGIRPAVRFRPVVSLTNTIKPVNSRPVNKHAQNPLIRGWVLRVSAGHSVSCLPVSTVLTPLWPAGSSRHGSLAHEGGQFPGGAGGVFFHGIHSAVENVV